MSDKKEENNAPQYKAKYILSNGYNVHNVTGCYGGVNVHGDIIANFYSEQHAFPEETTVHIDEDGITKEDPKKAEAGQAMRFVPCAIALKPEVARAIAKWLIDKADTVEDATQGDGERRD